MSTASRLAARLGLGGAAGLAGLLAHDALQRRHSILRTYPVLGRARFAMERIRPEIQQYFVENNYDRTTSEDKFWIFIG